MEFTADNLERAVAQFYYSNSATQAQAHSWLTSAQGSPNAWCFVWELLQPTKTSEVQFFAANTLHIKIVKNWAEIPVEQYNNLKKQILEAIFNYASGPKIVLNRLCIALAAFILHTIPGHWPNAVQELMSSFQPANFPTIPPDKVLWILLEILTVLPEEFQSIHMTQNQKVIVRQELNRSISQVLCLLEALLSKATKDCPTTNQAVSCLCVWLQYGVPITECKTLISPIVQIIPHASSEVVENIVDALSHLVNHPNTHKYPTEVMDVISRILPVYDMILQHPDYEPKGTMVANTYGMFVSMGETHSRLILNALTSDSSSVCFQLMNIILTCSNAPGCYSVHETFSHLGIGFWYILQDDLFMYNGDKFDTMVSILRPIYTNLAAILLRKAEFPPDTMEVSAEDRENIRCYRQDISDTLVYCYNVMKKSLIALLLERLKGCLENRSPWQPLEACLHCFMAVAESVTDLHNDHLTALLSALQTIPYNQLNIQVAVTALDLIGSYAEWLNYHPENLPQVIPLLVFGLQGAETVSSASISLKDITKECQLVLEPFSSLILDTITELFKNGKLQQCDSIRLMFSVGRILSILPLPSIIQYLNSLLLSHMDELEALQNQGVSAEVKTAILLKLKLLATICISLDTQAIKLQIKDTPQHDPVPNEQPIYLVLERVLPTLAGVVNQWHQDKFIIQAICTALKNAISTLMDCMLPLVPSVTELIANIFRLYPHPYPLEVVSQMCILYGRQNSSHHQLMVSLLTLVLQVSLGLPLAEHTDTVEAVAKLCSSLTKKNVLLLLSCEQIDMTKLLTFAIEGLSLPELPTVRACSVFIANVISLSREHPKLLAAVQATGEQLVYKVLRAIGGESSRQCVEPLSDIILIFNKKFCDNLSRWLNQMMVMDGFPSPKPSLDCKQQFVKMVLKERANKRRLQDVIKDFSLICRGLVDVECRPHL